ncbi:MAG TPA: hypothetical protein VE863_13495 [Pyrinomonadaceae bacterium]|nr:hypothetical protein [Pyrinomonadaceae bacterium]
MRRSIYLYVLGLVVICVAALASTGIVVSAQNSNSSMTPMTNTAKPKTHKPRKTTMAKTSGRCDPTKQEQTDLSGTYTGKVNHGDGAPQDATLTITGNTFTMTSGSETHSGSITAVTTCGYTAVTVMMGDRTTPPASPNPPPPAQIVSLRAKKVGDKLWLTSVPGETMKVSFTPTGGGSGAMKKPRKHKTTTKKTDTGATPKTTP